MQIIPISIRDETKLLKIREDHYNDTKSKRIDPSKLQETFVAFANSDGGDLYIGIEDEKVVGERLVGFINQEEANAIVATLLEETKPAVENVQVEFLQTQTKGLILHINIPKSPKVHYTASGDCYIRINAAKKKIKGERITALSYAKGAEQYEKKPVEDVEMEELAASPKLHDYMERVETQQAPEIFLKKQRLLTKKEQELFPNVGGILLFDEAPQATLPTRCAVKVYRLRTTGQEYKREQLAEMPVTVNGTLEEVIKGVLLQVQKYVQEASFHEGDQLVKLIYPLDALKEILVNAVIHRDYSLNDDIHVKIFDNRIEVQSPGRLPGYMTIENLYTDRFSRNPNIVRLLHNLPNPVNHDIGEGLDTAKNELRRVGLVEPIFEEKDNNFIVTIRHKRIASVESIILKHLEENPTAIFTNKLVRQLSGEDDMQKVKSALKKLRKNGYLELKDPNARAFDYQYVKSIKN